MTELVFRSASVPPTTTFHLTWPFPRAVELTRAWLHWAPAAPDELAASLVVAVSGEMDEPPSVEVFGTMLAGPADAREQLAARTARMDVGPISVFVADLSFQDALQRWAGRASERLEAPRLQTADRRYSGVKSEFFTRPLRSEAIAPLLDNLGDGRSPGQIREMDFTPWGGAYNRVAPDATAFVLRDSLFSLKRTASVAPEASPADRVAAHEWAVRSWDLVRRWSSGRVFPNFPGPDLEDWGHAYYGSNYERLLGVKARYDPDNRFRFLQSLPAP